MGKKELTTLNFQLSQEDLNMFKSICAKRGTTMTKELNKIIINFVEED